jgi:hypothetical protein
MAEEKTFELVAMRFCIQANYHNPSILTPRFLTTYKLREDDWEIDEGASQTGAVISQVQFKNGILWTADWMRLQVWLNGKEACEKYAEKAKDFLLKYVDLLPHVQYNSFDVGFKSSQLFSSLQQIAGFANKLVKHPCLTPEKKLGITADMKFGDISWLLRIEVPERGQSSNVVVIYGDFFLPLKDSDSENLSDNLRRKGGKVADLKKHFLETTSSF